MSESVNRRHLQESIRGISLGPPGQITPKSVDQCALNGQPERRRGWDDDSEEIGDDGWQKRSSNQLRFHA